MLEDSFIVSIYVDLSGNGQYIYKRKKSGSGENTNLQSVSLAWQFFNFGEWYVQW